MGGGAGGRTSPTAQARVKIDWKTLRLAAATGEGYGETAMPLEDLLAGAVKRELPEKKPILVLIVDEADEKTNKVLESNLFTDEKIALALKRFTCLRGELRTMPEGRELERLKAMAPLIRFYDPAGSQVHEMKGKRATSRSTFSSRVERVWDLSYAVRLKDYARAMGDVLDQMEKVDGEKARLTDQMDRAADNPRKLAALQKEETELKEQEEAVLAAEREVLSGVVLREEWIAGGEESAKKD